MIKNACLFLLISIISHLYCIDDSVTTRDYFTHVMLSDIDAQSSPIQQFELAESLLRKEKHSEWISENKRRAWAMQSNAVNAGYAPAVFKQTELYLYDFAPQVFLELRDLSYKNVLDPENKILLAALGFYHLKNHVYDPNNELAYPLAFLRLIGLHPKLPHIMQKEHFKKAMMYLKAASAKDVVEAKDFIGALVSQAPHLSIYTQQEQSELKTLAADSSPNAAFNEFLQSFVIE